VGKKGYLLILMLSMWFSTLVGIFKDLARSLTAVLHERRQSSSEPKAAPTGTPAATPAGCSTAAAPPGRNHQQWLLTLQLLSSAVFSYCVLTVHAEKQTRRADRGVPVRLAKPCNEHVMRERAYWSHSRQMGVLGSIS